MDSTAEASFISRMLNGLNRNSAPFAMLKVTWQKNISTLCL